VIGPSTGYFAPDNSIFSYSDHAGLSVDGTKARFTRPLAYGTLNYVNPGAMVSFRSDATSLSILLDYTNLHNGSYYYPIVSVFVDGALYGDFDPGAARAAFRYEIPLSFPKQDMRTIEVLMPYCAAVDPVGVQHHPQFRTTQRQPRPTNKLVAIGDSITHGFYVSQSRNSWPVLLAKAIGRQSINMGFAGAYSDSHGAASYMSGFSDVDRVTIMLGTNDAIGPGGVPVSLNTYQSNMQTLLAGVLANIGPAAKVFMLTPTWTTWQSTYNLAGYRTRAAAAVTAIGDARVTTVDGLSLATNSEVAFTDGVHPNDVGSAQIAAALAPAMV